MKRHYGLAIGAALLLGACSKISGVGDQQEPTPHATASTLGWPYAVDSPDLITATVRSGGDVLLSGKNSQKGDHDTGVPLIQFEWQQIAGPAVDLVYRTANTVYFTAPQDQPDNTELRFRLSVYDAKGNTDSTEARVVVRNIPDSDHFLHYLDVPTRVTVGLATSVQNFGANPGGTDTPVTVTMTKLVSFVDRSGAPHTDVPVAYDSVASNPMPRALTKSTAWTALHGGSTACADPVNPSVELPLPRLDMDDVLTVSLAGFPDAVTLGDVIEPSDIDQARVRFRLDVAAGGGVTPALCVGGVKSASGTTWNADDPILIPAGQPWDSNSDADAYYRTIGAEPTLEQWLAGNEMSSSLPKWGADAHAIYTNNFDLGFGRDMYMKTHGCDAGYDKAMPVQQRLGKCDVAAVVVNYADLEAAAKRTSPVIAVAMEYSRVGTGGTRFTKFFVYAPDTSTGAWRLVRSANLDGRGEQYVPGTCTVCHGGVPAMQTIPVNGTYPGVAGGGNGNINASFLPWDMDALLFSDTDPGFSKRTRDAELKELYTGAVQQDELKALNLGAYSTWSDPAGQPGRFALARELMEIWYGSDLSSSSFNSVEGACSNESCVPDSWKEGGSAQNPLGSSAIYRQVFASNCRACHVNQVPETAAGSVGVSDPRGWASCNNTQNPTNPGHQLPMACYWQFANAPGIADRLSNNEMPFARRTSDQFWLSTGTSSGHVLQSHFAATTGKVVTQPGRSPCIDPIAGFETTDGTGAAKFEVQRNDWIELGSSCSRFLTVPQWPVTGPDGLPIPVVNATGPTGRFRVTRQGDYRIALVDGESSPVTKDVWVRPLKPAAGNGTLTITLQANGVGSGSRDVTSHLTSPLRDPVDLLEVVSASSGLTVTPAPGSTGATTTITVTTSTLGSGRSIQYRLRDTDGDWSDVATIQVIGTASIAASSPTVSFAANSVNQSVNLDALVSRPNGQAVSITVGQTGHPGNGRGKGSTSPVINGITSYTAPPGVTSHFSSLLISAAGQDSFTYTACLVALPASCASGTVTVRLVGSWSFASVRTTLGNANSSSYGCATCHDGTTYGSAQGTNPNYKVDSSVTSHDVYCKLKTLSPQIGGSLGNEPSGSQYLDALSPASSLLYRKPQGQLAHGGSTRLNSGDPDQLNRLNEIFGWINEGAYYTESNIQSCP